METRVERVENALGIMTEIGGNVGLPENILHYSEVVAVVMTALVGSTTSS